MKPAQLHPASGVPHIHPAVFTHRAATTRQLDRLGEFAHMPVHFRATDLELPHLRIDGVSSGRINIWHTRAAAGFQTISKGPLDVLSLRVLRRGRMLRRNARLDYAFSTGHALLLPFEAMHDLRSSDMLDAISCSFSLATLEHLRAEIEDKPLAPIAFEPLVEIRTPALRLLVRMLELAFNRLSMHEGGTDLSFPFVEEMLIGQLLTAWPRRPEALGLTPPSPARQQIARALDYIDANLSQPLYVTQIARAVGVNLRSLQKGFRDDLGRTIVQHIIMRRLERARADLSAADGEQIKAVAYRWGFTNLSEFSRRYKARFGETPSRTTRMRGGPGDADD